MENISTSLRRLHMSGMAMCWKTMTETHQADKLTFRDGLEILIQSEMDTRHHNKIARLIKNAGFRQGASLEELETSESRGISVVNSEHTHPEKRPPFRGITTQNTSIFIEKGVRIREIAQVFRSNATQPLSIAF